MKTTKLSNIKSFSLLTLSMIALSACNGPMRFDKIAGQTGLSDPGVVEEPVDVTDPGEVDDPGTPVIVDPVDPVDPVEVDDPVVVDPVDPVDPVEPLDPKVEVFQQVAKGGKVDILFVIDNSPSMQKEQAKLGARLQAFMSGVKHLDWQISFTTTDVSNGKYGMKGSLLELAGHPGQKVLNSSFADAEQVFLNTVRRPEMNGCIFNCPSSDEEPLKASILSMQKHNTENAVFYRSDADLAIVVLSDEDELSKGSKKATKPQQVVDAFNSIFGTTKKLSVYGIIIQPNDVACYENQKSEGLQNASYGTHVEELARITKGLTGSICANDYTSHLENISNSVRLLSDYFELKKVPTPGTVSVQLSPAQNIPWTIEGNKLMFQTAPAEGTVIQVIYD